MNVFKPDDFFGFVLDSESAATAANDKLTEWIEKNGVRVYGVIDPAEVDFIMGTKNDSTDTHRGILICVEELTKKICEHVPAWDAVSIGGPYVQTFYKCSKCGVKLKAKWEVVEP